MADLRSRSYHGNAPQPSPALETIVSQRAKKARDALLDPNSIALTLTPAPTWST
jgi:hypothetical protein